MKPNAMVFDNDHWIVINALSDKASSYRELAADIRDTIAAGEAHPSYHRLAKLFDRQAVQAEQIRDALIADVRHRSNYAMAVVQWRNRLGVNRAAAAAKIGVGEKAIRDFEDSETEPGITVRLAMAAVEHGLAPIA